MIISVSGLEPDATTVSEMWNNANPASELEDAKPISVLTTKGRYNNSEGLINYNCDNEDDRCYDEISSSNTGDCIDEISSQGYDELINNNTENCITMSFG